MKLLIINYHALPLPPVRGGAVEFLVDAFLRYNEEHALHDITVYSIFDEAAAQQANVYHHTTFRYVKIQSLFDKLSRAVRHMINRMPCIYVGNVYIAKILQQERDLEQYDAIILENAPEFALKFPKACSKKLILHLHNDYLNESTKLANKIFHRFSKIFTISNTLGDSVRTISPSNKIMTLYNGVDLNRFSFSTEKRLAVRKKYGLSVSNVVLMYCGRIVPEKGVLELVNAFSKLPNTDHNLKLLIVGSAGYGKNTQSEYINEVYSASNSDVIFTGYIPYDEIADLYCAADIGVIPSTCNDAFNLTTIEFLANGIPVVISDCGAMKELVNEGCSTIAHSKTSYESQLQQAITQMIDRCQQHPESTRECALSTAHNFSIDIYCRRYHTLLESTAGDAYGEK